MRCEDTSYPTNCDPCGPNFGGTPSALTGRPIDVLTGAKLFDRLDYEDAAGQLRLRRLYNSRPYSGAPSTLRNSPIGLANWLYDFQYELQLSRDWLLSYRVAIATPDGQLLSFQRQTNGTLAPVTTNTPQKDYLLEFVGTWPSSLSSLYDNPTSWKLTGPDDTVWTLTTYLNPWTSKYDIARPLTRTTRDGYAWTFTYTGAGQLSQITDSYGKTITFSWLTGTSGTTTFPWAVSEATLPGGRKLAYTYETAAGAPATTVAPERLTKVELKDATSVTQDATSYVHENSSLPTLVTGELDVDAVRRWSVEYDSSGRATKSTAPSDVNATEVAYGANGSTFTRTVTNALGRDTIYTFAQPTTNAARLSSVAGQASANAPATTESYAYGTDKLTSSYTNAEGKVTTYTRNSKGQPTQIVEASGTASARTTGLTWHSTWNVVTQVVLPGKTIDFAYGTNGQLQTRTETDTTTYTTPYPTNGRTRTWTYGWSSTGQLLTVDGPLSGSGDTITYTYDTAGYVATVTNQVGLASTVTSVDWRGAPLAIEDPNGIETTLGYDIRGRLLSVTVDPGPTQSVYSFEYTAMGDIHKVTLPGGGWLEYSYDDARRLTGVENDRGETQAVANNDAGAPTSITVRDTSNLVTWQQAFAYDELNRLIQSIGAGSQTTSFAYDKLDSLTQLTDARSKVFMAAFDPLNRLISETDPNTHTVEYGYNGQDALTTFEDGRSLTTSRKVDGFGRLIEETSPDRGTRSYWYDNASNVTKIVDGDGVQTDFTYDTAGRRLTATFPSASAENVSYTYDSVTGGNEGKGRLTAVDDESGSATFEWDAHGRLAGEAKTIEAQTYASQYSYDVNGRIVELTMPSGRTVTYTRAADGLVTGVTTKASPTSSSETLASGVTWQPFGPLKTFGYGNGLTLERKYDQNGWLDRIEVKATGLTTLDLSFGRNANGELTSVTDNASTGRAATYGYTDAGLLNVADGAWGSDTYAYDAAGNRSQSTRTAGGVTTTAISTIPATNNRITEIRDSGSTLKRSLTYRSGGAVSSDDRVGDATYTYTYNARGRMTAAAKGGVDAGHYGYDAFGQRVWRETFGAGALHLHYVYDTAGHLIAEHDASSGTVVREYVWLEEEPLAVIDYSGGTPATYFIHTGQIGEPLVMTDSSKSKVWDVAVEPFGTAKVLTAGSEPLDLRLPGQWLQVETGGLHQNWMRDYDPSLGRYAQADPLGIFGGSNLYAYASNTPLLLSDPTGLATQVIFTYDRGSIKGSHTALRTDNSTVNAQGIGDGIPSFYDPSGDGAAFDRDGYPIFGTDMYATGEGADLGNWMFKEYILYGTTIRIYTFATTPAEEAAIMAAAQGQGGGGIIDCARFVSGALSAIQRFRGVGTHRRPISLEKALKRAKPSSVQTFSPPSMPSRPRYQDGAWKKYYDRVARRP